MSSIGDSIGERRCRHTVVQMIGLGYNTATDAKYDQFGQALDEVSRGVDRYLAATDGHEAHLLGLIEAIKSYLDTRGF